MLSSQQIETRFNRAAATYHEVANLQRAMADDLIKRFQQCDKFDINAHPPIVDLGCGTGYLIRQLAQRGWHNLHGFDLASDMLTVAASQTPPGHAQFVRSDLLDLPVDDDHFDVVFSNAAIQWCDTSAAAAAIKRALSLQGRAFISTFGAQTLHQWREVFAPHGLDSVHQLDSPETVAEKFRKTGLSVDKFETAVHTQSFHTVSDMFDSIKKLGASNAHTERKPISKPVYRSIRNHFQKKLERQGSLDLSFEVITFESAR